MVPFGHPLAGLLRESKLEESWLQEKIGEMSQVGNPKSQIILVGTRRRKESSAPMWGNIAKEDVA